MIREWIGLQVPAEYATLSRVAAIVRSFRSVECIVSDNVTYRGYAANVAESRGRVVNEFVTVGPLPLDFRRARVIESDFLTAGFLGARYRRGLDDHLFGYAA